LRRNGKQHSMKIGGADVLWGKNWSIEVMNVVL